MRSIGRHLTTSRSIFANGTRCYSSRQESQGSSKSGRVESEFAASLESLVGNLDTPLASRPATQSSTAKPTDTPPSSVPTDRFVEKHDGIASFGSQANTPKPMSSVKLFRGGAFAEIASKSPPEFFDDEKKVTPRRISGRFGLSRKRQAVPGASTAGSPRTSPRTQTSSGNQVRSSLNPRTPSSPTYRKPQNSVQQFGKKSGKQVTTDDPRGGRRKRETKTDDMEYEVRGDWKLYVGYMIHSEHPRVITYAHLRELCTCEKCIHPTTRQRLQTPGEVFDNLTSQGWLRKIPDTDMLSIEGDKLSINWDGKGAHRHEIDAKSVLRQIKSITQQEFLFLDTMKRRAWDLDTLDRKLPKLTIDYSTLRHKDGHFDSHTMYRLLYNLQVYGIVKLKGVPTEMTDNETCELRSIAQAIGPIKDTFYGETWDVRNQPDSKNVAYTDLNLGLHMDLLYFTDPPRFQLLHCLRNRVEGGNSYFVDAFKVAEDLEQSHPAETVSLKNNKLLFEYKNDGHHMSQRRAVLSSERHATDRDVAWSPPFQGVRPSFPQYQETAPTGARSALTPSSYALQSLRRETAWLKAMRLWEERLDDEKYRYEFKMEEGDLVLFDNRRVLHARRAFRDWTPKERQEQHLPDPIKGEPSRWLKGCYIDGDVVWDRLSVMYNERAANDSKRILLERISRATGMHS